jgi:2-polyprenyl-6-methoxyphenol hydroxylase-like FAD-dependent oxidoreductase
MMLARDNHEVTILERDPAPVPATPLSAWEAWERNGVAQFRQGHFLAPAGSTILKNELPDVHASLVTAGAAQVDFTSLMPPTITDRTPRPHDDRFVTFTARRPVLEQVMASRAHLEPGLDIRRGVTAVGLTTRRYNGTPHVMGVRLASGEQIPADLVVDAMGRRSPLPEWLMNAGAGALHEEAEDSRFTYYTRFFRSRDGKLPEYQAPVLTPLGTYSLVTYPCDNNTWTVAIYSSSSDQALKRLRDPERWNAVVAACPLHAHWLDGEPITDILPMGGIIDRYRRPIRDGQPIATGIALLADAWASTNPSQGRGISFGLHHATRLRDIARTHLDNPDKLMSAWDAVTESELTPWYRETVAEDRARIQEMEALRDGSTPPPPDPTITALLSASMHDPDIFRAFMESRCCITTLAQTLARPGLIERHGPGVVPV